MKRFLKILLILTVVTVITAGVGPFRYQVKAKFKPILPFEGSIVGLEYSHHLQGLERKKFLTSILTLGLLMIIVIMRYITG